MCDRLSTCQWFAITIEDMTFMKIYIICISTIGKTLQSQRELDNREQPIMLIVLPISYAKKYTQG